MFSGLIYWHCLNDYRSDLCARELHNKFMQIYIYSVLEQTRGQTTTFLPRQLNLIHLTKIDEWSKFKQNHRMTNWIPLNYSSLGTEQI